MCLKCHVYWLQEMCLKFCPIATVPGSVKEISKFPGVGNVHSINRKGELFCPFHEISWARKFPVESVCAP